MPVKSPNSRQVLVIQDGARLHYAIPAAIQRADLLAHVYTSWYAPPGSFLRLTSKLVKTLQPDLGRRLLDRYSHDLGRAKVSSFPSLAWKERTARKRFPSQTAYFQYLSEEFAKRVRRAGFYNAGAMFGFIRNIHPSLCATAKERGLLTIADQMIAPFAVELAEEKLQSERFPEWSSAPPTPPDESWVPFEEETWRHLDHVTCASAYVRDGLLKQDIPGEKISVLPYPINPKEFPLHDRSKRTGPLTVGFVGAVGTRKGTPYFAQVAKKLASPNLKFVMVGPIHLKPAAEKEVRQHVELTGSIPRSQILDQLRRFDIFLFPSTCEGSAGAVMEAMATGLPVICSPNSGSLIEHGKSGFIAPYDAIEPLVSHVEELAGNSALRQSMATAARVAIDNCTIDNYSKLWVNMMGRLAPAAG